LAKKRETELEEKRNAVERQAEERKALVDKIVKEQSAAAA